MTTYKLNRYNFDEEIVCFESENPENVAKKALMLSATDNGEYTYRMEAWEDGEMVGDFRYFQDGKEFTEEIIKMVMGAYER